MHHRKPGKVEFTCDETRNAKRSSSIGLGITLLQTGNMPANISLNQAPTSHYTFNNQ